MQSEPLKRMMSFEVLMKVGLNRASLKRVYCRSACRRDSLLTCRTSGIGSL